MEASPTMAPAPTPSPAPAPAPSPSMEKPANKSGSWATVALLLAVAAVGFGIWRGWLDAWLGALILPYQWQVFTPELILLLFALLAPLVALRDPDRGGMQQFAAIGLAGAFLMTLLTILPTPGGADPVSCASQAGITPSGHGLTFGRFEMRYIDWSACSLAEGHAVSNAFSVTLFSQFLKLVFLGVGLLAVVGIGRPLKGRTEEDWGEFYALLLFATLGMMIVASATELFTLLLGIEMASMSSYLLATFRRDAIAAEAGLKYFVIGAISSGMTLFAVSLLYGMAGTTRIPELAGAITTDSGYDAVSIVAVVLLLAGLGFKVSSVPFHAWAPDVYAGAPVPVAGMLAAASKAMGFAAIFNVFLVGLIGVKANWELAVALVAAASMFVGNLVALQQTSIRRMLAYSSIAQAGYLLIAVAVGTWYAVGGGLLHLFVNAAMKLGAFLVVGALLWAGVPDYLDGWKGLGRRAPFLAFAMVLFLLSMAGLPPLGGFTSKFVLFSGAIDVAVNDGLGWLAVLALLAVLNSAISLYYYLRVIRAMYVEPGEEGRLPIGAGTTVAVGACALAVLAVGLWPDWFVQTSMEAARSLLRVP